VAASHAPCRGDGLQFLMLVSARDAQRRVELFEDLAVAFRQEGAELGDVVSDQIEVEPVAHLNNQ
jgi:hypothetical protein